MATLDNVTDIRALDPGNMYNRIFDFPEQLADAQKIASGWKITSSELTGVGNIVVIGMGGSAIGGDLVRSLLASKIQIPFQVVRHYALPEYVDDDSLVIASSYSGNTEETLAAVDDALGRKALMVAMTTGGMLREVASLNDIPCLLLPSGMQPRAALGYAMIPILYLMDIAGFAKGIMKQLPATIELLKRERSKYIEDLPVEKNAAKMLAQKLAGRIPVVYGGATMTDVVATRWKGQLCENGKSLAFANQFAEFNHNELVGWNELIQPMRDKLAVIQLHDADDHPKITKRMEIVRGLIQQQGVPVYDIKSTGSTPLERMMSLVQIGDFVSYYLAIAQKVDPTPVAAIETLKKQLA